MCSSDLSWINELGIDKDNREVELHFDGQNISINKKQTAAAYVSSHKQLGHCLTKTEDNAPYCHLVY